MNSIYKHLKNRKLHDHRVYPKYMRTFTYIYINYFSTKFCGNGKIALSSVLLRGIKYFCWNHFVLVCVGIV